MRTRLLALASALSVSALMALAPPSPAAQPQDGAKEAGSALRALDGRAGATIGPVYFRNDRTGRCMDIPGVGGAGNGTPVNQYSCDTSTADNQRFYLDHWGGTPQGLATFTIRSVKAVGMCVDPPGEGNPGVNAPLQMWTCIPGSWDNQRFYLQPLPSGREWIRHEVSGLCLDVAGLNAGNDARLQLYYCTDGPADDHNWSTHLL
ncbi:RICIN domain-containing protein [Streptomyces sp. IBSNAI002]|uniref:RICIN domain-containing protein n=1 Tax=Streptomyces sp. IBSNAI002 TaxID=3457500 RepID=UPI003FD2ECA3